MVAFFPLLSMTDKNLYDLLGVARDADAEQIRRAYVLRSKMLHPDRFDPTQQSAEWEMANEMLKELNHAYRVLRDPTERSAYDRTLQGNGSSSAQQQSQSRQQHAQGSAAAPPPQRSASAGPRPAVKLGPMKAGKADFDALPESVRKRLKQRVSGEEKIQYATEISAQIGATYLMVVVVAMATALFFPVARALGELTGWVCLAGLAAVLQAFLIERLVRWYKSRLRSWLIITPLYVIRTHFDTVSYWPVWEIRDVKATDHYRNGTYQRTSMDVFVGVEKVTFDLSHALIYMRIREAILASQKRALVAQQQGDVMYFHEMDDFREVVPNAEALVKRHAWRSKSLAGALAISLVVHWTVVGFMEYSRRYPNVSTPALAKTAVPKKKPQVAPTPVTNFGGSAGSSYPHRPSSYSDSSSDPWERRPSELLDPAYLRKYDAYRPAEDEAVRYIPKPTKPAKPAFTEPEQPLPMNGAVQSFSSARRMAPFEIKSDAGSHYLVKLADAVSGRDVLSVFVRGGQTVNIDVPLGTYVVKHASGEQWYGYVHLFGPQTSYSKAETPFSFTSANGRISGYTMTLYKVVDGNLRSEEIDAEEF